MLSETKFNLVFNDLSQFGTKGHERLEIHRGVLRTKNRGSWFHRLIQHFYKPKNERIQTISKFALQFFQEHEEDIVDPNILESFVPTLCRTNCGTKLETLIARIKERILKSSDLADIYTNSKIEEDDSQTISDHSVHEIDSQYQDEILRSDVTNNTVEAESKFEDTIVSSEEYSLMGTIIEDDSQTISDHSIQEAELERQYKLFPLDIIREAIETAVEDQNAYELIRIVRIQVKLNLPAALETAKRIKGDYDIEEALSIIAVELAKTDLIGAILIARQIENSTTRKDAIAWIAGVQAKVDLAGGLETAKGIEDNSIRAEAFTRIAEEKAKSDPFTALEIAEEIQSNTHRLIALAGVAKKLAQIDIAQALETVSKVLTETKEMQSRILRISVLRRIAPRFAKFDMQSALEAAKSIEEPSDRSWTLLRVAKKQLKIDKQGVIETIREALAEARECVEERHRLWALSEIAPVQAKFDLDGAFATVAEMFDSYHWRSLALTEIVMEQAKVDLPRAIETAKGIEHDQSRAVALTSVAVQQAQLDMKGAIQTAKEIEDIGYRPGFFRGKALVKLVVEQAKFDLQGALETARGIDYDPQRAKGLAIIGAEIATEDLSIAIDVIKEAIETARSVDNASQRIDAFIDILEQFEV